MKNLLVLTALCSIALFTGCHSPCNTCTPCAALQRTPCGQKAVGCTALGVLADPYTRRGNILHDVSTFRPLPGETYECYRKRLEQTLEAQSADISDLTNAISHSKEQSSALKTQLEQLQAMNADLRQGLLIGVTSAPASHAPLMRYEVQKGDTLQTIAKREYGTHTAWLSVYRLNTEVLPDGPNHLDVGQELLLPSSGDTGR